MPFKLFQALRKPSDPAASANRQIPSQVLDTLISAAAPIGIFQTDQRGNCLFVNDRWCRFTGMTVAQACGQGWVTAVHPDDRAEFFSIWSKSVAANTGFSLEFRLLGDDGNFAWVRATAVSHTRPDDNSIGFVGIVSDISDRKRTEQALRDSETRLRAVIETAVNGVVTIDSSGIVNTYNASAAHIFGFSADEVVGRPFAMLMPDLDCERDREQWEVPGADTQPRLIATGKETVGIRKGGTNFPAEIALSQFRVGGERMYAGIIRDISERKQIERMKDEFVSVVSHELRTPLTSISGALTLVQGGFAGELPEKAREMMEIARKNCSHLMAQLNDILDVENLWAGRTVFTFDQMELGDLVRRAVDMVRMNGTNAQIEIVGGEMLQPAFVRADAGRIVQVISNLLTNAIKFSPLEEVVEVRLSRNENWWRVAVTDYGRGVPGPMRPRMFQRFVHAEGVTERAKSGMGLGLAIARSIVAQHGGHIGYDSEDRRGATFWFELPMLNVAGGLALGSRAFSNEVVNAAQ